MSTNYTQYLGAKRCCDLKVQGPQGPQGAQGQASIGGMGYQGATGTQGYQGATGRGCAGPTGAQGLNGVTGSQGATGAQGAEGSAGGAGLILYYNYSLGTIAGGGRYPLQRTTDYTANTLPFIAAVNQTVLWRLYPTVATPFTISGGSYQSVIFASSASTGTIQITSVTDEIGATLATISNPPTVTGIAVTPYLLIGNILAGPFNFNTTTNTYIDLTLTINGTLDITFQTAGAYSNINLLTPVLVQGVTGAQGSVGMTGAQGSVGMTGAQGSVGMTGSQGATGSVGMTGSQGATGSQGDTGSVGATGSQGATGSVGITGAQGDTGPVGITGPIGSVGMTGAQGDTGSAGSAGAQGDTGSVGMTGAQGATGPSQWTPMNGLGTTGGGYTGIGITGQDVLIYGNLLVTGGIDPIYLALTPGPTGPQGFINPLWVDSVNQNALRSEKILISNGPAGTGNLTINNSLGTGTSASLLTLNQTTTTGILYTEKYNQRTATTGIAIQESYFAKNGATKTEFSRVRIDTPTSNSGQYTIVVNQGGTLVNHLTANGSSATLDITATNGLNMSTHAIAGVTTITDFQGLNFLPQANVQAISNTPINIPVYNGDHQILLKASSVPIIDTLVVQTQFIGSGSVNCSAVGNGFQWLGTNNGEIYCYDVTFNGWTLVAQFNGAITALFYAVGTDRLYIGGSFSSCSNPSSANAYGNVAYIPAPSTSLIIPDNLIWSGASNGGFNNSCLAITGDGADNVYFGGNFTNNADNSLILNFFACYEQPTNVLSALDNNTSNGFNGTVLNLDFLSGTICATGNFTNITTSGVPTTSPYCVVFAISGNAVSSVNALDGGATTLATAIGGYDFIDNDGTDFIVVINQSYSSPAGNLFYLIKVSVSGVSSVSGSNSIFNSITSFFRKVSTGSTHAITNANDYYIDSALATAMGTSYFTFNYIGSDTVYFNLQGVGSQWAFVGASYNNFLLGGGRQILWYNGSVFTTGYLAQTPNYGATLLLNWNGTYYVQICSLGSPTAWNPYT